MGESEASSSNGKNKTLTSLLFPHQKYTLMTSWKAQLAWDLGNSQPLSSLEFSLRPVPHRELPGFSETPLMTTAHLFTSSLYYCKILLILGTKIWHSRWLALAFLPPVVTERKRLLPQTALQTLEEITQVPWDSLFIHHSWLYTGHLLYIRPWVHSREQARLVPVLPLLLVCPWNQQANQQ